MCGITGIFDTRGTRAVDVASLQRMNDSQHHRGPDEGSVHVEPGLGFGHRRLSIIDIATGQQPLFNEDGTYTGSSPAGESAGTWAISGSQTCFTQSSPEPTPASCSKTVSKNVGESWQSTGQGGAPVTVTIQAGR